MEQKRKVIDDIEYAVTQMDAFSGLKIQTKLLKLLGKGAIALINDKKPMKEKINDLVPLILENFDDQLANEIVSELFRKDVFVIKEGKPSVVDFSTHFRGYPFRIWKVVGFILETNFSMGE